MKISLAFLAGCCVSTAAIIASCAGHSGVWTWIGGLGVLLLAVAIAMEICDDWERMK